MHRNRSFFVFLHVWALFLLAPFIATAQQAEPPPAAEAPAAPAEESAEPDADFDVERGESAAPADPQNERRETFRWRSRSDDVLVHIGEDAYLGPDERANAVVAIFGSALSRGEVDGAVVALFGNARAEARVREAVIALFGDVYVNDRVGHEVVALFGDVTLGPDADVDGDVIAVGGRINRDEGAVISGGLQEIALGDDMVRFDWLRAWIDHALLYGRPLAIEPGLGWAWALAFGFLAFYILLALMFGDAVERCVKTLERHPGPTLLTALLSMVLTPVAFILLLITVLGVLVIPFLAGALFIASLFGKAVVLAWIGRRVTRFTGVGPFSKAAFPVLVGGLVMLGVYLVPVLGFVVYKLAGILGLGAVLYTVMLALQVRGREPAPAVAGTSNATNAPPAAPVASAPAAAAPPEPMTGVAASAPRAGFWIRMVALFIDAVLVGVIFGILQAPGEIWLLALAGYGVLMWKLKSTTIGGIVCNLQVVRADGRELDWDTAIVRALSCFLSLAAAGLGFIWIAFDDERQAWHDKIAGTVVVRARPAAQREALNA